MMYYHGPYDPFHFVFNVIAVALLVWLILTVARGGHHGKKHWMSYMEKKDPAGMDILKERYARGEISKEEFESKKKDLME